jgi:hypothetical protein
VQSGRKRAFGALFRVLHRAFRSLFHRICEKRRWRYEAVGVIARKLQERRRLALAPERFASGLDALRRRDRRRSQHLLHGLLRSSTARSRIACGAPTNERSTSPKIASGATIEYAAIIFPVILSTPITGSRFRRLVRGPDTAPPRTRARLPNKAAHRQPACRQQGCGPLSSQRARRCVHPYQRR